MMNLVTTFEVFQFGLLYEKIAQFYYKNSSISFILLHTGRMN